MLIARLAIVVIATDCSSQSLADSRMTIRLLYMKMIGVSSIDSTMLASTGLCSVAGTSVALGRQRQQDEAELAGLRQVEAGADRGARRGAEEPRQRGDERRT